MANGKEAGQVWEGRFDWMQRARVCVVVGPDVDNRCSVRTATYDIIKYSVESIISVDGADGVMVFGHVCSLAMHGTARRPVQSGCALLGMT